MVVFLKQDILEIGGFDEHLVTDEDGDLILRLMFNGILFISQDKSKYLYRHHNNSVFQKMTQLKSGIEISCL